MLLQAVPDQLERRRQGQDTGVPHPYLHSLWIRERYDYDHFVFRECLPELGKRFFQLQFCLVYGLSPLGKTTV